MGSTRAGRLCPQITEWMLNVARAMTDLSFELIDLRDWPLPTDDEPEIPQRGIYAQAHTCEWSRKVAAASGFIIVTPQYNWGYPAPLKNALDHLYNEWKGKPVTIMTYGGHGGGKCAVQIKQVLEAIGMKVTPAMPAFTLSRDVIMGAEFDVERDFVAYAEITRQSIVELNSMI
jgi:NAD(P)H-dependent FMN reductase